MGQRVLINFSHGLGDATQLTIILKHLAKQRPEWIVDVESSWGKHSLFYNLCNHVYIKNQDPAPRNNYNKVIDLCWVEPGCEDEQRDVPLTKVTVALRRELHLEPNSHLYNYTINITDESRELADYYLRKLPQKEKIVGIHYQANSSSWEKDISQGIIERLAHMLIAQGYIIVILDWDGRSPLPNRHTIFCPSKKDPIWDGKGTGDGNIIAALIEKFSLFIGVDSGPEHIAGSTRTPTIIVWKGHHPLNFFDLSDNCIHLLPGDSSLRCSNRHTAEIYFRKNYQYTYYNHLESKLRETVSKVLNVENVQPSRMDVRIGRWWQLVRDLENPHEVNLGG